MENSCHLETGSMTVLSEHPSSKAMSSKNPNQWYESQLGTSARCLKVERQHRSLRRWKDTSLISLELVNVDGLVLVQ